jgi:hypothetical protein
MKFRLVVVFLFVVSGMGCRCFASDGGRQKNLSKNLVGAWVLVSHLDGSPIVGAGTRIKVFTGSLWIVTEAHYPGGSVVAHQGGSYVISGDVIAATTDYALPEMLEFVGNVRRFRISIVGDTYTQIGVGNPYSEIWRRVKEPPF